MVYACNTSISRITEVLKKLRKYVRSRDPLLNLFKVIKIY